jgi:hypothetical protein
MRRSYSCCIQRLLDLNCGNNNWNCIFFEQYSVTLGFIIDWNCILFELNSAVLFSPFCELLRYLFLSNGLLHL